MKLVINGVEVEDVELTEVRKERDAAHAEVKRLHGQLDRALAAGEEAARDRDAATRALYDLRAEQIRSRLLALPQQLHDIARKDAVLFALMYVFARSPLSTLRWLRHSYLERSAEALCRLVEPEFQEMWFALWPADHFDDLTAISMASSLVRGALDRYSARLLYCVPTQYITLKASTEAVKFFLPAASGTLRENGKEG